MSISVTENFKVGKKQLNCIVFIVLVFIVSLLVRGYRLAEIQPHHDESPAFGFARGEPLQWDGSAGALLSTLFNNAAIITEGDSPPMICVIAELFRFLFGENLTAARWFHAIIQSIGVAIIAWLAWRIFWPVWAAILSVVALAIFSVVSINFGQFGEVYAIYFTAGVIQYLVYWIVLRGRYTWCGYLVFIIVAYIATLVDYLQALITVGLLLATISESGEIRRSSRLLRAWISLLLYGILNAMPFFYLVIRTTFHGVYRHYYSAYYPINCFKLTGVQAITGWFNYLIIRTYDLFNYHISLVFDKRFYQPLEWNWISLPFILPAIGAVVLYLIKKRRRSFGILAALSGILAAFILGNILLLVPYGGVRNTLFIAPVIWLAYGAVVAQYQEWITRRWIRTILGIFFILLAIFPFFCSLPQFYSDRVARLDPARLEALIKKYRPDTLIMAEATYDPFRMILQRYPEFKTQVLDKQGVNLTSFFELDDSRWEQYPLPIPGKEALVLDFYISFNGRNEGTGIINDHPNLTELSGPDWIIEPVLELPGPNIEIRQHQSIYYPPNSVYIYLMRRK
jgi:hypothetical protein